MISTRRPPFEQRRTYSNTVAKSCGTTPEVSVNRPVHFPTCLMPLSTFDDFFFSLVEDELR